MCRHRHADLLFDGVEVPPVPDGLIQPYPDLGHAIDGETARHYASFRPQCGRRGQHRARHPEQAADRVRALAVLDIDAIWWRDDATWTRPDTLMTRLADKVFPALRTG